MALYIGVSEAISPLPTITLSQLTSTLGAQLRGDGALCIGGMASLDQASEQQLSFCTSSRDQERLQHTRAGAVLLTDQLAPLCNTACIIVDDVRLAYAKASQHFSPTLPPPSVHASAVIDPTAQLADSAHVGPLCHIAAGAFIGERAVLESGAIIGCDSHIDDDCHIGPHAVICHGCQLGKRTSIGSGSVIGGDGFGFAWVNAERRWEKIAQLGRVLIGDDVEIGSLSTIDRGALDDTTIGNGVKIDNQVHLGHGVQVGDHCAFAGNTTVAGSTRFGSWCRIGGGAIINGHLDIGAGASITGSSSVMRDIPERATVGSVIPASDMRKWLRTTTLLPRLQDLFRRVSTIEQRSQSR